MSRDRRAQPRVVVYRAEVPEQEGAYEAVYEAIADALHFACRDLRTGRRTPLQILEDGVLLYDAAAIAAHCEENPETERLEAVVGEHPDAGPPPPAGA